MITIVICTRKSKDEWLETKFADFVSGTSHVIFYENTKGLSERYNEVLDYKCAQNDDNIFIMMHDDITINMESDDWNIFEENLSKLEKILEESEFDIMGLAGTSSWTLKSPAVWHNSDKSKWSGLVRHSHQGKEWDTNFGPIGKRCIIVDGLFIAAKVKVFKDVKFDPQFTFHHYDMDFCLSAHQKGYTIGTVPIDVTHYSVGDFRNDPVWHESEKLFIEKWSK